MTIDHIDLMAAEARVRELERDLADARRAADERANAISVLHGKMFKIACELFEMQKNGEQLAKKGLAEYELLIYGPGRPVKPHRSGGGQLPGGGTV